MEVEGKESGREGDQATMVARNVFRLFLFQWIFLD